MLMRWRPRIGAIVLAFNLVALALPLSGIWTLRIYESALIRQTESELIAQSAVIAATFREAWRLAGGRPADLGPPVDPEFLKSEGETGSRLPRSAVLDLAEDPVLPEAPEDEPTSEVASLPARQAGGTLTPIMLDAQRTTLAGMRVVDHRGIVVATTREGRGMSMMAREEARRALRGEAVSLLRARAADFRQPVFSRGTNVQVFTAMPIIERNRVLGAVILSRTPRTLAQALYGKRWHLVGLAGLLVVVLAGFGGFAAFAIARPLKKVTAQAKQVAQGSGTTVVHTFAAVREVAEMSEAIATMSEILAKRADYIANFANHVSHEFKTPLTAIRGAVELLDEHLDEMTPDRRHQFLKNVLADTERLDRLVRRLLDLARADVLEPGGGEVALRPVLQEMSERFTAAGLIVQGRGATDLLLAVRRDALEAVLVALLENTLSHAGPGTRVTISARRERGGAVLRVADNGPGISRGNADRVFERFFTTARESGGTGLGLPIARSLLAAHGGTIELLPDEPGAVFEIRLPVAQEAERGERREPVLFS